MKVLSFASILLLVAGTAFASQDVKQKGKAQVKEAPGQAEMSEKAVIAEQLPSYPVSTCLVSDEPLVAADGIIDYVQDGRLVRLCCKGCIKMLKKDPASVFAKLDAAVVEAQRSSYPLETCVISGEPLGGMGDPIEYVYGTRLVRLCCKGCVKGFKKDPAGSMAKIDAALIEAQRPTYAMTTCPVSGNELGADAVDRLYGTRLVRFCCGDCAKKFKKEPQPYLAKLDAAGKK